MANTRKWSLVLSGISILLMAACTQRHQPAPISAADAVKAAGTEMVPVWELTGIDLSGDGSLLVAGGDRGATAYTTSPRLKQLWYQPVKGVEAAAVSPDASRVAVAEDAGVILVADGKSGQPIKALKSAGLPSGLAFSPDGDQLAIGLWGGQIFVWNLDQQTTKEIHPDSTTYEMGGQETMVAWSHDGKYLAGGGWRDEILIWDMVSGQQTQQLKAGSNISVVALSPDDRYIAALTEGNQVVVWDLHSGALIGQWSPLVAKSADPSPAKGLAWSPDSSRLAASTNNGRKLAILDVPGMSLQKQIDLHFNSYAVMTMRWSPDGKLLYLGEIHGNVDVWNLETDQEVETLSVVLGSK